MKQLLSIFLVTLFFIGLSVPVLSMMADQMAWTFEMPIMQQRYLWMQKNQGMHNLLDQTQHDQMHTQMMQQPMMRMMHERMTTEHTRACPMHTNA